MKILVVAAHPDDEVLGCGGTIARLINEGHEVHILILADGESSRVKDSLSFNSDLIQRRTIAAQKAGSILGCTNVTVYNLPDNRLDGLERLDIINLIEKYIDNYSPRSVFTHHSGDVNIDHYLVHDAVITACRPQNNHPVKEIFFFEVPSSSEWRPPGSGLSFHPNYYVDISKTLSIKMRALEEYKTEMRVFPHPRSQKAVEALATWRGSTVGIIAAEAFILGRKIY